MGLARLRLGSRRARGRRGIGVLADESGASAVEFALVLPVLCLMLFGIIKLGIAFTNYIQLTNAAAAGAHQLSISRGSATPWSGTNSAIAAAAPNLTPSSKTYTVGGTACTDDSTTCQNLFGNGTGTPPTATVTLTYTSCNLTIFNAGFPTCTLSASSSGAVQ